MRCSPLLPLLALAALALTACPKKEDASSTSAPSASAADTASAAPSASASAAPSASASALAGTGAEDASAPTATSATAAKAGTSPAAGGAATAAKFGDGAGVCGKKPLPDCPLQHWMKENTAAAMASNDLPAAATALDKIVKFAPAGYTNWASIAKDGAAAARKSDADGTKAACRTCHDQYKNKYKSELRTRPVPQ